MESTTTDPCGAAEALRFETEIVQKCGVSEIFLMFLCLMLIKAAFFFFFIRNTVKIVIL